MPTPSYTSFDLINPLQSLSKKYKFLRELVFCCFGKGLGTEEGAEIDNREDGSIGVGLFIGEDEADDLFEDIPRLHLVFT